MSSINFDNAYWLLIAVPLVALFTVMFALSVRKQNANGHNIASYALHIVLAAIVAFTAAGASIRTVLTETDVYVVADVSHSTEKNLDTVDAYIKQLKLPHNSKLGVVCFGKDCEILYTMGSPRWKGSVKDASVDDSETDIAGALSFTGELFRDDVIKRIVLISDGKQTDRSDAYAITRAVDGLAAKNIKVDAIWLDDNLSPSSHEVQISSVDFTKSSYLGREEAASVSVQSTYATKAVMTLTCGEETVRERSVNLTAGVNVVNFDLDTSEQGSFDYKVEISAEGDENGYNNLCTFTQTVTSELKVLVITESWEDVVASVERYGSKAAIDVYENDSGVSKDTKQKYTRQFEENPNINIYSTTVTPYSLDDLLVYDEYVLADLQIKNFSRWATVLNNIEKAVSVFGKGLVTFGNLNLQTDGNQNDAFADMLPVRFGNDEHDPRLFTIVIDSSRSMEQLYKLSVAKKLAVRLVGLLGEGDEVCIITFYGSARMVQSPTPVTDNNRNSIISLINALTVTQGTVISGGLQMAYDFIVDLNYKEKQVMLITDGLDYMAGATSPLTVASTMYDAGIVTSVIDVGRQGDQADGSNPSEDPSANRAKAMLLSIASRGHGTYFYNRSVNNTISEVTFADISDTLTETVIEKETTVSVLRSVDKVLEGIDATAIPDVSGYIYSAIKPSASTVLVVNHQKTSGTTQVPLYAYWKYGEGRVATFTSTIGGDWLKNWKEQEIADPFLDNVFRDTLPEERISLPYTANVEQQGTVSELTVKPAEADPEAIATVRITTPDGDRYTKFMAYAGDRYTCSFDCSAVGKYLLEVLYTTKDGKEYPLERAFHYSYATEYDVYSAFDPSELYKAVNGRGAVSLDGKLTIENGEDDIELHDFDLTAVLMAFAVVLLVTDIAVRKLKWEDIKSFFGIRKKEKKKKGGNAE